jgi:hypothetical protein
VDTLAERSVSKRAVIGADIPGRACSFGALTLDFLPIRFLPCRALPLQNTFQAILDTFNP